MANFIPRSDTACLAWSANYVQRITANPDRYGIDEADIAELAELQAEFAEKLYLAKTPGLRTSMSVEEKNVARMAMERAARRMVNPPQTQQPTMIPRGQSNSRCVNVRTYLIRPTPTRIAA